MFNLIYVQTIIYYVAINLQSPLLHIYLSVKLMYRPLSIELVPANIWELVLNDAGHAVVLFTRGDLCDYLREFCNTPTWWNWWVIETFGLD